MTVCDTMCISPAHCINFQKWLFAGLSLTEAKKLSSYFHFTEPSNLKNKTLLEKANWDPSTDFLDSLEHDIPPGKNSRVKRCNEREGSFPFQRQGVSYSGVDMLRGTPC